MNRTTLALAAGCAVLGAAAATLVAPAIADQYGGNEGSVTISKPRVSLQTRGEATVMSRVSTAGNIETGTGSITVKKGSTTVASGQDYTDRFKRGTYSVTTKVRYRYVTFNNQEVQVVTKGASLDDVRTQEGDDGIGGRSPAVTVTSCKVTTVDTSAHTFEASCALTYDRTIHSPPGGEDDVYDIIPSSIGSMTFTGTYDGTTGRQDGHDDALLTIDPVVGGKVERAYDSDDDVTAPLYATRDFYLTFWNRSHGAWHTKSKTYTVDATKAG